MNEGMTGMMNSFMDGWMDTVTAWVSGGHFEVPAHRLRVAVEGLE